MAAVAEYAHASLFRLLVRCSEQKNLAFGSALHGKAFKSGVTADVFFSNSIVVMYAKCSQLPRAAAAFEDIGAGKDVVSWNSLINSYSQIGPNGSQSVFHLFRRMRAECGLSVLPNCFTFAGVFTAASHSPGDIWFGRCAHCVAIKVGNNDDVFLGSSLLNMYCKQGCVLDARKVFDRMPVRNSVSWSAMISGYAVLKSGEEAFGLFKLMLEEGQCAAANEFVLTSVLSALSAPGFLVMGQQVHSFAITNGWVSSVSVENSLITLYAKCKTMEDALLMFELSANKSSITWSAMITGYAQNGDSQKALHLFPHMQIAGFMPTEFTFVGLLNACSDMAALVEGKQTHTFLIKVGFELQSYVKSALVDMYAKCGCIDDARKGFEELKDADIVLWTSMIGGYVQNGEHEEALALYGTMRRENILPTNLTLTTALRACASLAAVEQGKQIHACSVKFGFGLGIPIGSSLSTMYAKCGDLSNCSLVFGRMPQRDVVAWNSVISGFSQNGRGIDALNLFEEMKKEGTEPDHVTFVNLLSACSHVGLVESGWSYLRSMLDDYGLVPKIEHYACMADILSRAGLFKEAKNFIESVPIDHGTCLWRIMLGACHKFRHFDIGAFAGEKLMELGTLDSSAYICLANIYAAWGKRDDVERVRRLMRIRGVDKDPGCSWVDIDNTVHVFVAKEMQHPDIDKIYAELKRLTKNMKDEGYCPTFGFTFRDSLESPGSRAEEEEGELNFVASAVS
ncbi:pentatricopeptide repeat-containing protein At2g33680-like [Zingiber officinale]|uniref:Pentatricopeptide repeat-containing protein n=1 Tax=Zingiber officinale TaxID=94328 RepID=A0A8J5HPW9_ZINOF|nr:pentatricopeptide repeat-containing protein At2g33680-like [Zingiber officinale]KAG6532687.1 hypothetical protein ZIOFF_006537 [Zingiber officinale]